MIPNELKNQLMQSSEFKTRGQIWHFTLSLITDQDICLEFGVFNGKSINYMSEVRPDNLFFGFDSFEGLPENYGKIVPAGHFKTNFEKLKFNRNVRIQKGIFEETIPKFLEEKKDLLTKIKFIHIDCDIYSSTKTVLNLLSDIIISNKCLLLFDEFYNHTEFENHEFLAFLEWVNSHSVDFKILGRNIRHQQALIQIL